MKNVGAAFLCKNPERGKMTFRGMVLVAALTLASLPLWADAGSDATAPAVGDWPQWLGPNRNGFSSEKGLLREWPKEGPKVLWRVPTDIGWSVPSIAGDDVIVCMKKNKEWNAVIESVRCLSASTGQTKWQYDSAVIVPYYSDWIGGGPRGTPTITDKYVYAMGAMGHLTCLDRKTGALVWQREFQKEFWPPPHREWKGFCFSPVVKSNVLMFPFCLNENQDTGYEASYVIAFPIGIDAVTGKDLWKTVIPPREKKDELARVQYFQTPAFAAFGNDECAVYSIGPALKAFRLTDGKEIWNYRNPSTGSGALASPIMLDKGILLMANGGGNMAFVEVDRSKPPFNAKVVWTHSTKNGCPHVNFVPVGDYLYGFEGSASTESQQIPNNELALVCLDMKTGNTVWEQKGFHAPYSMTGADGLLFVRSFQTLTLVEATPKGYAVKGKMEKIHSISPGGQAWGLCDWVAPALSRGRLYIRTDSELLCIQAGTEVGK